MEISRNETLIGNGVLFPIQITKNSEGKTGWYPVKGDIKLIENNLRNLVEHIIGSRFRQEYWGTRIWECLEEPSLPMLLYLINYFIQDAIGTWEPRISYVDVNGYLKGSTIYLDLRYRLTDIPVESSLSIKFNDISEHE